MFVVRHELGEEVGRTAALSRAFTVAEAKSSREDWAYVVENEAGEILGRWEYGRQVWDSLEGSVGV